MAAFSLTVMQIVDPKIMMTDFGKFINITVIYLIQGDGMSYPNINGKEIRFYLRMPHDVSGM